MIDSMDGTLRAFIAFDEMQQQTFTCVLALCDSRIRHYSMLPLSCAMDAVCDMDNSYCHLSYAKMRCKTRHTPKVTFIR